MRRVVSEQEWKLKLNGLYALSHTLGVSYNACNYVLMGVVSTTVVSAWSLHLTNN